MIEQHALASWLESGQYDRHVRQARPTYAARRAELSRHLERRFAGWPQRGIPAGLEILLELPDSIPDQHVAAHARQMGLGVTALSSMRFRQPGPPGLVLSYARLAPQNCAEAVARLHQAVTAVQSEDRSLAATVVPTPGGPGWQLTSANWPAAPDDFYP